MYLFVSLLREKAKSERVKSEQARFVYGFTPSLLHFSTHSAISLRTRGGMLARLHLELVYHLLDIRYLLGQAFGLRLLLRGLHAALDHQRSVLRGAADALILQVPV